MVATHRGNTPPDALLTLQKKVGEEQLSFVEMDVGSEASISAAAAACSSQTPLLLLAHPPLHNAARVTVHANVRGC